MKNKLLVNITWNSKDWKGLSDDASNHRYVKEGGTPNESWNFDFDNERNTEQKVYGYAQFTHPPKVTGNNNLIIFYSQNQIVGMYGRAEILEDHEKSNEINLAGDRSISLLLPNKINDVKEKGYLETKERIGQVGYIYLEKLDTVVQIIDEAIQLNPNERDKLLAIKEWIVTVEKENNANKDSTASTMRKETVKSDNTDNFGNAGLLNQILFGPPGTGKTYHTVNKALQIVDPEFYEKHKSNREKLTDRYRQLLITDWAESKKKRIAFTTFHQSFTYEDFVEGIKPDVKEGELNYKIEDGIFKRICRKAKYYSEGEAEEARERVHLSDQDYSKAQFFKVSLGDTSKEEDDEIYQYCMDHNKIAIGYLGNKDLSDKSESQIKEIVREEESLSEFSSRAMNYFIHYLKKGHYVLVSRGNTVVRAIGKVTGDYEYSPDAPIRYPHFRGVEWLVKDVEIPVEEIYEKNLQQQPIYMLKKDWISREFFEKQQVERINDGGKENFVLIIDEINRGNIAQIFGELITLIEKDKREGGDEELKAILPYSKKPFSVPSNLHIIGTMNTADRSIEALDTALRRRFTFEEIPPKPKVIEEEGALNDEGSDIRIGQSYSRLSTILETINKRIEKLLDKDHLIGHSYFMDVKSASDLQRVFYRNIIPLLEEYFYGDKGKIQLVLGQGFIKQADHSGTSDLFASSDYDDTIFEDREIWELTTVWRSNEKAFEDALNSLLNKKG